MEHLRHFIKDVPVAAAMLDRQLCYLMATNEWVNLYRMDDQHIIGKSQEELFPLLSPHFKEIYTDCLQGHGKRIERNSEIVLRADGTTMCVRYVISPWYEDNNEIGGLILFSEPLTNHLQTQHTLQTTIESLRASNHDLQQYAHICAHDLKEPLRNVASFTQLLAKEYRNQFDNNAKLYIEFILKGVARMQEMIQNILASAMPEGPEKSFVAVDMNMLMAEVSENFTTQIAQTHTTLNYHDLPTVYGNRSQLLQLMQNLISNAIKCAGDKPPFITVHCEDREEFWQFAIEDHGIGMDTYLLEQLTEMFRRVNSSYAFTGKGIGLTVCKKVVDLHHGKIWVESTLEQGTTFYFTLPKHYPSS